MGMKDIVKLTFQLKEFPHKVELGALRSPSHTYVGITSNVHRFFIYNRSFLSHQTWTE